MTSKNKNGGNSWGTLYGRPMEGLEFCYNRHEDITKYRMTTNFGRKLNLANWRIIMKLPNLNFANIITVSYNNNYHQYLCCDRGDG